ncbi:hypothetical protein V1508DRAFT_400815 [Lipomyces doorenjongii]|uniref:uncharacterized protein n=1 Tax=Lipomyces doorenjongii TaxID=383834 RepID=UPI0034D0224B
MTAIIRKILLSAALWSLLANGAPYPHGECPSVRKAPVGKAIYFLTNDAENAVVAVPIGSDGTLSYGTVTATGGAGLSSISGSTMMPSGPDALLSQDALTIVGQNLFAVNAGSNTLTMMSICESDPTILTPVGKSVSVLGEFPNTVAASAKNNLVCVGSTGAKAGISCATFSPSEGLSEMDFLRPFDLGQSTPPVGPTNTVSQTFFSEDESLLLTTVKGDPTANKTGFLSVFPVNPRCDCGPSSLSAKDTRSSPPGTAVLFGSEPIPGGSSVFVVDPSFGAVILSLDEKTRKASLFSKQVIADQKATCWATISPATNSAFVTDPLVNHIVEMSLTDAKIISTVNTTMANANSGLTDLKAAGNFIYALSPGNGTTEAEVLVLNVAGGKGSAKVIQSFGLNALGVGKSAQGMEVLM